MTIPCGKMKTISGQVQYTLYPPRWQVPLMKKNQKIILLKCSGQIYPLDVLLFFESTLKQESSYSSGPSRLLGD